ncbi:AP2/B3 transcription factor family protein [Euphorbia peplus]|nr:AP2/B3 transcription factor family protein [Euphorbia peplus]
MIRDGSYQPKFVEFLRTQVRRLEGGTTSSIINNNETKVCGENEQFSCMQLFQKELTPSDVDKLNRLVIPKKFAVKYFPYMSGNSNNREDHKEGGIEDIELMFYDGAMKCWKFKYCYWKSSQSFVFTRGWNRFVKEKNLNEKYIVTFYACVAPKSQRVQESQHFSLIDVSYSNGKSSTCLSNNNNVDGINQIEEMQKELELKLGQSIRTKLEEEEEEEEEEVVKESKTKRFKGLESKSKSNEKGLRLFGVQIS